MPALPQSAEADKRARSRGFSCRDKAAIMLFCPSGVRQQGDIVQEEFIAGRPVCVGRGLVPVQRILGRNAGPMTGPGTNTYVLGKHSLAIVDPGPADPEHIDKLLRVIDARPVEAIFVTHTHGDHSPGTALLLAQLDAQVIGLAPPVGSSQDPSFQPSRLYVDNERIACSEFTMRLLHTPGHVSNHLCFLLESEGLLFTGDHILAGTTPVILPPDGNMRHYLQSLERLKGEQLAYLAPAHGGLMDKPYRVIDTLIRHRMRREAKLQRVLRSSKNRGAASLAALTGEVYDDISMHLWPWAQKTLLAHLIKLQDDGEVVAVDGAWMLSREVVYEC